VQHIRGARHFCKHKARASARSSGRFSGFISAVLSKRVEFGSNVRNSAKARAFSVISAIALDYLAQPTARP